MPPEDAQLIGPKAAAQILGVHRATVWRFVKNGDLTAKGIDARMSVYDRAEVEALRDRRARELELRKAAS